MNRCLVFFGFFVLLLTSPSTFAYPEFIGYGYSSCLTCHFNGHGNGPLNDYGRALWSSEIASQAVFPAKWSQDEIASTSGIIGSKELPWWIRPAIKSRHLYNQNNPGSPSSVSRTYPMQLDLNSVFIFDHDSNYILSMTFGQIPQTEATRRGETTTTILREFFFRAQPFESWWFYVGLLDKVYGIRNLDHTSNQRLAMGLNQYSQSHGIVVHKISDKWELSANAFFGNTQIKNTIQLNQEQKGFSFMGEFEPAEKMRLGGSYLSSSSAVGDTKTAFSAHYRQGLLKGSSILAEFGFIKNKPAATAETNGNYAFIQTTLPFARGYSVRTAIEKYIQDTETLTPEQWRYTLGLLAFPIPRLEFRLDVVNGRNVKEGNADEDTWKLQGQVHVSL